MSLRQKSPAARVSAEHAGARGNQFLTGHR
jgi:hypothetical protein